MLLLWQSGGVPTVTSNDAYKALMDAMFEQYPEWKVNFDANTAEYGFTDGIPK